MSKPVIFDDIGAAAVRELQGETHLGYRLMAARMREHLALLRVRLETDLEPTETARVRGSIETIKLALEIPTKLLNEYRKGGGE
jgi:hypothetical protein